MSGYRRFLPEAEELIRQRNQPDTTLEDIGARYGVSRQAVHKAIQKYLKKTKPVEDARVVTFSG